MISSFKVNEKKALSVLFILSLVYVFFSLGLERNFREFSYILYFLTIVFTAKFHSHLFKTTPFYFLVCAILIAITTWILTSWQIPNIGSSSPRLGDIVDKFAFLPLAVLLMGNTQKTFLFWLVAATGAVLTPWFAGNGFTEIKAAYNGLRTGFGGHIITMGIVYSTIAIACLVFYKRFFYHTKKPWGYILWFLLLSCTCFGIYASQTRSVYLGIFTIYALSSITILYLALNSWRTYRPTTLFFILTSTIFITIAYVLQSQGFFDSLIAKVEHEESVFWLLLSGNLEAIPNNSSGLRIHFWIEAYQWILERPWTGWGAEANKDMHLSAGNYFGNRPFITVHNDLLDILLAYGLLGAIFYISLITWLTKETYLIWKKELIGTDLFVFFLLFLLFFLLNGTFMSLLFFRETVFLWNVVLAGFLGFILKHKYIKNSTSENDTN